MVKLSSNLPTLEIGSDGPLELKCVKNITFESVEFWFRFSMTLRLTVHMMKSIMTIVK